ncbi:hypothetical protein [Candidatus Magnetominusculus xianensis]|uniref:Uncharacterized protein n=1 Tax=Candidatus Magnetominusculus xianensis TaxID=1748249 RepID=A0ABR5SCY9_9BACT|nr:hypothetical protein [Candidatus Magnetominusculus xianensis]KWT75617.1 hypothetical protein ASN18_3217 [Candidatus Magnetominusculus xianensis]MBF0403700.1 hypothetical protein [Nitrospirota bacterium]
MEKRKTIIVALAVIALIYGLYVTVISSRLRMSVAGVGDFRQSVKNTVKDIETRLQAVTNIGAKHQDDKYIVQKIETKWDYNPFGVDPAIQKEMSRQKEPAQKSVDKKSPAAAKVNFVYSAYIETNKRKVAVINDNEYKVGDQLETPGYVLRKITSGSVVIAHKASKTDTEILFTDKGE